MHNHAQITLLSLLCTLSLPVSIHALNIFSLAIFDEQMLCVCLPVCAFVCLRPGLREKYLIDYMYHDIRYI